jgi:hypothetical protein
MRPITNLTKKLWNIVNLSLDFAGEIISRSRFGRELRINLFSGQSEYISWHKGSFIRMSYGQGIQVSVRSQKNF